MGVEGTGPFDNDDAWVFLNELGDRISPAKSVRQALARLRATDRPYDIDEACTAWAACELVAIAASGGEGYGEDALAFEAAARLRPTEKLIRECLAIVPRIACDASALAPLFDDSADARESLASTRERLERGLTRGRLPRLRVPKIKSVPAYAIDLGAAWLAAVWHRNELWVLERRYDERPAAIAPEDKGVLLTCWFLGDPRAAFTSLGRTKLDGGLALPYPHVTIAAWGCHSNSAQGSFERAYALHHGDALDLVDHETALRYPFRPELTLDGLMAILAPYAGGGAIDRPKAPTPDALREAFLKRCKPEWASLLAGEGGGPFSFGVGEWSGVAGFVRHQLRTGALRTDWHNEGMCLGDDLAKYFLTGIVAASFGAIPKDDVPPKLRKLVQSLRPELTQLLFTTLVR